MIKRSKGASAETWTYGYDNNNELIWVQQRATDGGTLEQEVTYSYDALGQRIQRTVTVSGVLVETDRYGLDRGNVWVVLDGSNNFGSRHIFGPATDQIVARVTAGGAVAWYLTDYENSVTVMVDGTGTVQDRITYDGFGNILTETAPTFGDGYKYTGREWDATAQLQYNRARYYDPAIGKWISQDPLGFTAGDANLYRYVGNAGTNGVDPSGMAPPPPLPQPLPKDDNPPKKPSLPPLIPTLPGDAPPPVQRPIPSNAFLPTLIFIFPPGIFILIPPKIPPISIYPEIPSPIHPPTVDLNLYPKPPNSEAPVGSPKPVKGRWGGSASINPGTGPNGWSAGVNGTYPVPGDGSGGINLQGGLQPGPRLPGGFNGPGRWKGGGIGINLILGIPDPKKHDPNLPPGMTPPPNSKKPQLPSGPPPSGPSPPPPS